MWFQKFDVKVRPDLPVARITRQGGLLITHSLTKRRLTEVGIRSGLKLPVQT